MAICYFASMAADQSTNASGAESQTDILRDRSEVFREDELAALRLLFSILDEWDRKGNHNVH